MTNFKNAWKKSLKIGVAACIVTAVCAAQASAQSLLRDTEIEEVLQEFTTPILKAADLSPESVDIYLVNDPSLNAFVTRGQNIFLHSGLILEANNPNQLKGVIAHETGHIVGAHIVRSDEGNSSAYGALLIAAAVGIAAILAGETEAGALVLGGSQQFAQVEALAYSRTNESAADQYAAKFLEETNESGAGLIAFFEKFRAQEILSNARRFPYFRGHPLSSRRIDALRERVAESPHAEAVGSEEDQHIHEMMQAKLHGFLDAPQIVYTLYPLSDQSKPARYARAVANFKAADLKNAIKEIDSLIEDEPENPYFYELKSQILYESGKGIESIEPGRRALELKPDAPLLKTALARSLMYTEDRADTDAAIALIKSALFDEENYGYGWYLLAQAYGQNGQDALAKYATAERFYAVGDYVSARSFAQRAQKDLARGDPQWRRASDIIVITNSKLSSKSGRRRGPKPFNFSVTSSGQR
ncbi:MAG: M48 family metalloprotease [Litorimonas sp.]